MHKNTDTESHTHELYIVAAMHYIDGQTMESIAHQRKVSRSTVSRMLKEAREQGIVQVTVRPTDGQHSGITQWYSDTFGVTTTLVPVPHAASPRVRLDTVATMGALELTHSVNSGDVVGLAWGNTMTAVARHLNPTEVSDVSVVQLNGAASAFDSGAPYAGALLQQFAEAFNAQFNAFPVPAFFDRALTREVLWNETSVRNIRSIQLRADVAIFGIGSLQANVPSMVYSGGYLSAADMDVIRAEGVVGDVCTVLLRADGTWEDLELNQRASGPNPRELQMIPKRIAVVAGVGRVAPTLAALRAGIITHLVIDKQAAERLRTIAAADQNS